MPTRTRAATRRKMKLLNMANKLLGQHFLKNPAVAKKMIRALAPERGEAIIEIGAGHGELTRELAGACKETGCELFSIEKDRTLAEQLSKELAGPTVSASVISGDALKLFAADFPEKEAAGRPYKIVGNIPYYLTGHLLRLIGEQLAGERPRRPRRCVFMLQKEVAERIVAKPPRMNRLAASIQFWAEPKIVVAVPKENFHPMPKVDSAIVALDAKPIDDKTISASRYYAALRALFTQPRKTILNNLAGGLIGESAKNKDEIAAIIEKCGLRPNDRPQNAAVEAIVRIAEALF